MDQLIQDLPTAATSIQIAWGVLLAISVLALTWMSMKLLTNVIKVAVLAGVVYALTTPVPELQHQVDGVLNDARAAITDWVSVDEIAPSIADIAADQLLAQEARPDAQALDLSK